MVTRWGDDRLGERDRDRSRSVPDPLRPHRPAAPHARRRRRSRARLVAGRARSRLRLRPRGRLRPVARRRSGRDARAPARPGPVTLVRPPGIPRASASPTPGSSAVAPTSGRSSLRRRAQTAGRVPCLRRPPRLVARRTLGSHSCAGLTARCVPGWRAAGAAALVRWQRGSGVDAARLGAPADRRSLPAARLGCPISTSARRRTSSSCRPGRTVPARVHVGRRQHRRRAAPASAVIAARRGGRCARTSSSSGATAASPSPAASACSRTSPTRRTATGTSTTSSATSCERSTVALLVRDRKSGFCLSTAGGTRARAREASLAAAVRRRLRHRPARTRVRVEEGSSVGYTDRYPAFFHGQDIDITDVARGPLRPRTPRQPDRRLRELRYSNNAASALIRLSWPAGRSAAAARRRAAQLRARRLRRASPSNAPDRPRIAAWSTSTSSSSAPGRRDPPPRSTSRGRGARAARRPRAVPARQAVRRRAHGSRAAAGAL